MRVIGALLLVASYVAFSSSAISSDAAVEALTRDEKPVLIELDFGGSSIKSADLETWEPVEHGQLAWVGDELSTGPGTRITLLFFEGSIMQLEHDTHVRIVDSSALESGSTTIDIFQFAPGNTWSRVAELFDTASSYNVLTSAGVGLVRGTQFKVTVHADGSMDVASAEGEVELSKSKAEKGVIVKPGKRSSLAKEPKARPTKPEDFKPGKADREELEKLKEKKPKPSHSEFGQGKAAKETEKTDKNSEDKSKAKGGDKDPPPKKKGKSNGKADN